MDDPQFWTIIAEARTETAESTDPDQDFLDAVAARLEPLPKEEIAAFQQIVSAKERLANSYGLTGALYVMTDGGADELDFEGFRGWLISQGQAAFERAVADPDSLADEDVVPSDTYLPEMLTLAAGVYKELTAEEIPADPAAGPLTLSGEELSVEDLPAKLPRLCDQFFFGPEPAATPEAAE